MRQEGTARDAVWLLLGSILISYFLPWSTSTYWTFWLLGILGLVLFVFGLVRLKTNRPLGIRLIAVSLGPFIVWLTLWLLNQAGLLP
ncbi:MAG: hypothetical protein NTZ26_03225 [Candidatus Aminicenantes bacterium]|nr:hypothetical protein [Candidatus Aminicenantes bacterium]